MIAEEQHDPDLDQVVVDGEDAHRGNRQDEGDQEGMGDLQHARPDPHQGQVQDQQHDIADVHAGGDRPEKIGVLFKEQGPGRIPWTSRAPIMTAAVPEPGTPRTSSGIMAPPVAALLALSGAATPSMIPVPNFSGCLEILFSVA